MTALIFLLLAIAMVCATGGSRGIALGVFGIGFVTAILWFNYHIYDRLNVAF